jgi:spore coat protein CotH
VRAAITIDGEEYKPVGVRLKGQGSFRPLEDRPSLAVKFDEFAGSRKFCGLTKIMLNNSSQDRSYLSEYICTGLYRDAGVPVGRVTFARVELNERDLGFYVLIEAMNKTFLRQHFRNPNGPLYEAYAKDIDRTLDQDSGPPTDQSDIRQLVAAARSPVESRMAALDDALDVDNFLSSLAVCMLIAQHDSYALNRNNYRLYREPDSHRFTVIPHGIDGSFTRKHDFAGATGGPRSDSRGSRTTRRFGALQTSRHCALYQHLQSGCDFKSRPRRGIATRRRGA